MQGVEYHLRVAAGPRLIDRLDALCEHPAATSFLIVIMWNDKGTPLAYFISVGRQRQQAEAMQRRSVTRAIDYMLHRQGDELPDFGD